jgi:hypothetical protein
MPKEVAGNFRIRQARRLSLDSIHTLLPAQPLASERGNLVGFWIPLESHTLDKSQRCDPLALQ